jgi:hypothetical protein
MQTLRTREQADLLEGGSFCPVGNKGKKIPKSVAGKKLPFEKTEDPESR